MSRYRAWFTSFGFGVLLFLLGACAAGIETEVAPTATLLPSTPAPTEIAPALPTPPSATPTPFIEERFLEVEWPSQLRLGDSDIVRLALIPSESGYTAQLEYPEHSIELEDVEVPYQPGYEAMAVARMDAAGMDFEPRGEQVRYLKKGEGVTWRWTIYPQSAGRHRLTLGLSLRWDPLGEGGRSSEVLLWQSGIEILVKATLGLSVPQARAVGIAGLLVGSILALPFAELTARQRIERARANRVRQVRPNRSLAIETQPGITLSRIETDLMQAVFDRYSLVTVETRFSSGYSGARTLLVQPIRQDGRADAHAIVKIGSRKLIQAEYANYQTFVRQTLPPITSRVLGPPVVVSGEDEAALQYTFIGTPDTAPESLRSFALDHPAAETARLIEERLFSTFGPTWWMQRRPFIFRVTQEYDRLLPVHLLIEPVGVQQRQNVFAGDPSQLETIRVGDVLRLENALVAEVRPKRKTATMFWPEFPGMSPVRVRFRDFPAQVVREGRPVRSLHGRVVASRYELLGREVAKPFPNLDLSGDVLSLGGRLLPNPIRRLREVHLRRLQGTRAVIHGDLNLENVLVGPGDLVWLIDFAATREGHTLFDFARLEVELTTQVAAEIFARERYRVGDFLQILDCLESGQFTKDERLREMQCLIASVRRVAQRCLYDPADRNEFRLSLIMAYLGTLKFANLDEVDFTPFPKALAFTAAAHQVALLEE